MANAESMTTSLGADPYSRRIAGSVIAQQLGLGFVTAVDPTQGEQGMIVGNFLTLLGITLLFATDMHRCRSCSG
jgi:flagellar biosynthesis protein FliR